MCAWVRQALGRATNWRTNLMCSCILQVSLKCYKLDRTNLDRRGILLCSCVLQVSLKSHNLNRTNLDTHGSSWLSVCFRCPWRATIWTGPTWILEVIMCSCVLQVSLKSHNLDRTNLDTGGYHVFLCASGVPEKSQSGQDQPGYTRFPMSLCVLQVSLKSHNLDRTNLDTRGSSWVYVCARLSEEPQSGQDQPGYTWILISFYVLQVTLKGHNLDRTNLDTHGSSWVFVRFRCPPRTTIWTGTTWIHMDYHKFLCASGVPEKSQSGQDQPGYRLWEFLGNCGPQCKGWVHTGAKFHLANLLY
jgi:hypothetical protein